MTAPDTHIRELHGPHEQAQAEDLQLLVWGGSERDIYPRDAMRALQHIGGLVAGALHEGQLIGLVVGFPTARANVQHSHMLAVDPHWRGQHLAQRLKEFQRDWCAARGITEIDWTYDPLRALNAHFNIHRLGATAHEYLDNFYGEMGGINAGVPSDRLVALWTPQQPTVRPAQPELLPAANDPHDGAPCDLEAGAEAVKLHIPADLGRLLVYDPAHALAWRLNTRAAFHELLGQGFVVVDFVKGETPAYILTRRTTMELAAVASKAQ